MYMFRTLGLAALLSLPATLSNAALVGVDLSLLSDGSVSDPTVISVGDIDVSFSNPSGDGLQVASGLSGLTSKGICANSTTSIGFLSFTNECEGALQMDFSEGVDDLSFTIDGISLLSSTTLAIDYSGGTEIYNQSDLLTLSLFGSNILGGQFNLSGFEGINTVVVQYNPLVGINEAYLGDIYFSNGEDDSSLSAVPVPYSLPLAASGLGLLGAMRLRRKAQRG